MRDAGQAACQVIGMGIAWAYWSVQLTGQYHTGDGPTPHGVGGGAGCAYYPSRLPISIIWGNYYHSWVELL